MNLILMPWGLFVTYGAIILGCGATLGVIVGRNWRRRTRGPAPVPPDLLHQRVLLLERELEDTGAEVRRLAEERDFMRDLRGPHVRGAAA